MIRQPQSFDINHLFCCYDLTHETLRAKGNVESQRLKKCWEPGFFLFLAKELISVPKVVK